MFTKTLSTPARRVALGGAVLAVIFSVTLIVSPAARAALQDAFRIVAGIRFVDEETAPPDDAGPVEVTTREVTLDGARTILPFKLPTQLPDGFAPYDGRYDAPITVTTFTSAEATTTVISLRWENLNGPVPAIIGLQVMDQVDGGWFVGDAEAVEEIQIGDLSAALWYGAWNYDTGRFEGTMINLSWLDGGLRYTLIGEKDQGTTVDDLIVMAGSME